MIFKNISEIAKKKNLSISKVERLAGLGNGTIGGWRSASPKVENLQKVADALNVPISKLLKK